MCVCVFLKCNFFSVSNKVFIDVHTIVFVGFGFFMAFLKRYGYGSVGFNFLIGAYVIEWALLVRGWFDASLAGSFGRFNINISE